MKCSLRPWGPSDAPALTAMLSNRKLLNNLRDGLPYEALRYKSGFLTIQIEIAFFVFHHRSPLLTFTGYRSINRLANVQIR